MIHLVRHGETEWSRTDRHTGRTDVELTASGEQQARSLAPTIATIDATLVLTSPLQRARRTCDLAGAGAHAVVDDRLMEWDYGDEEGRTTAQRRETTPGWTVWTHPFAGGESLDDVTARADDVVADLLQVEGSAVVFAHGHFLRILASRWCGLPAVTGQHLDLAAGSISALAHHRETPTIVSWNVIPAS